MARQAQAARLVALVMSVPRVMHARRVTTASVVQHVPLVITVRHATIASAAAHARLVTIVHLVRTAPTVRLATNMRSAMVAPFAKDATSTPRASLIAPYVRRVMSDVTTVPFATTVRHATIASAAAHARLVTTAHLAPIALIVLSDLLVTTVPPAVTRTSTPRVTKRRSTSPATTSYSSVFRRWRPPLTTLMA